MNVRKIIKKFLFNNGYELFRRYYYDFDGNDSIKKVLKLAGINFDNLVIFDIGANVGQSVDRFRTFSKTAKIHSFEPNPVVFEKLKKKQTNDKNLECYNVGIGSEIGNLKFNIQPDSGASSFYKMNIDGDAFKLSNTLEAKKNHNLTTLKQNINFNTEIDVTVKTLDSIFKDNIPDRVDLIKIDTQGYEEEVLLGASNILKKTLIVEAEVIFSDAYNKSASLKGIESILEKHGFILWDIPYIGKFADTAINRINFIDALFVNTNLLSKLSSSSTSNNK